MLVDFVINIFVFIFAINGIIGSTFPNTKAFGILFLILLGKIFIGTIAFIILSIRDKVQFIKTSLCILIPWIIMTVLIILVAIYLNMNHVNGAKEMILITCIGTIIWNKVVLYDNDVKWMVIIYNIFSTAANYLLIIIVYIISRL